MEKKQVDVFPLEQPRARMRESRIVCHNNSHDPQTEESGRSSFNATQEKLSECM